MHVTDLRGSPLANVFWHLEGKLSLPVLNPTFFVQNIFSKLHSRPPREVGNCEQATSVAEKRVILSREKLMTDLQGLQGFLF